MIAVGETVSARKGAGLSDREALHAAACKRLRRRARNLRRTVVRWGRPGWQDGAAGGFPDIEFLIVVAAVTGGSEGFTEFSPAAMVAPV